MPPRPPRPSTATISPTPARWAQPTLQHARPLFCRLLSTASSRTPAAILSPQSHHSFRLSPHFLAKYRTAIPPFGFNGLGEIIYRRTYSRINPVTDQREHWGETIERVVNGTYSMQRRWIEANELRWDAGKAQASAQRMYDRMFRMKLLPPGRGLWAMGSVLTSERGVFAALNNCAFVSTGDAPDGAGGVSRPFTFLMDAAMLGVGVGFDTKGAALARSKNICVASPSSSKSNHYLIPDSREGWVKSVGLLIDSYFDPRIGQLEFDYSQIRPAGLPIKGFGGISSGPGPLKLLHESISNTLDRNSGAPISVTAIVDIMNLIGRCVVSGNVRRTAEIAFGDALDDAYIDLKNYDVNPHRSEYGWTSNNSVFATLGMDYRQACERVLKNGEPGFAWLENARAFGRMLDPPDHRDQRAMGGNPCLEQTLESYELCCLVETFPHNHDSLEDYLETLQCAFLYAKTVTLGHTHWPESNRVMLRNRRIGTSMSGIAQFISARGLHELQRWCMAGYRAIQEIDKELSEWLCIPRSIKTTTIKPSGTVSLLAGATPGMHYPESRYCIRRVRVANNSELVAPLREAGYHIEQDVVEPNALVVEFPIDHGQGVRGLRDVSMWEQLSLTAFLQKYWSDNQVSSTVTFDPEKEGMQLEQALNYFQYQLKGISFLPRLAKGAYQQMPYEAIDANRYHQLTGDMAPMPSPSCPPAPKTHSRILKKAGLIPKRLDLRAVRGDARVEPDMERYCDADSCVVDTVPQNGPDV